MTMKIRIKYRLNRCFRTKTPQEIFNKNNLTVNAIQASFKAPLQ